MASEVRSGMLRLTLVLVFAGRFISAIGEGMHVLSCIVQYLYLQLAVNALLDFWILM